MLRISRLVLAAAPVLAAGLSDAQTLYYRFEVEIASNMIMDGPLAGYSGPLAVELELDTAVAPDGVEPTGEAWLAASPVFGAVTVWTDSQSVVFEPDGGQFDLLDDFPNASFLSASPTASRMA